MDVLYLDISEYSPIKFSGDPPTLPVPIEESGDYTVPVIYFKTDGLDFGEGSHPICAVYDVNTNRLYDSSDDTHPDPNYIFLGDLGLTPPVISGSDDIYVYVGQFAPETSGYINYINFQIYTTSGTRDLLNFLKALVDDLGSGIKGVNLYGYTKIFATTASYSLVSPSAWILTILDEVYGAGVIHYGGGVVHYDFEYTELFDGEDHLPYWVNTNFYDEYIAYGGDPNYILRMFLDFEDVSPAIDKDFIFEAKFTVNFADEGGAGIGLKTEDGTLIATMLLLTNSSMPSSPYKNIVIEANGYSGVYKVASFEYDIPITLRIKWDRVGQQLVFYYGTGSTLTEVDSKAIDWVLAGKRLISFLEYLGHVNTSVHYIPYADTQYFKMRYIGQGYGLPEGDVTTPVVRNIEPVSGAVVSGTIVIKVEATNEVGSVRAVEVNFDGGEWLSCTYNSTSGYWEYSWNTRDRINKSYVIVARALA